MVHLKTPYDAVGETSDHSRRGIKKKTKTQFQLETRHHQNLDSGPKDFVYIEVVSPSPAIPLFGNCTHMHACSYHSVSLSLACQV